MKTTLRELKEIDFEGYDKLTSNLKINDPDTEVSILQILKSNGIQDAVYTLQTQEYKNYNLFNADVAESVLHLFEDEYPDDDRPRKGIEGIRLYHAGKITWDMLDGLKKDVYAASSAARTYASSAAANSVYYAVYYAAGYPTYYSTYSTSYYSVINVISTSIIAIYPDIHPAYYPKCAIDYIWCIDDEYILANRYPLVGKKWKEIEIILRKYI